MNFHKSLLTSFLACASYLFYVFLPGKNYFFQKLDEFFVPRQLLVRNRWIYLVQYGWYGQQRGTLGVIDIPE